MRVGDIAPDFELPDETGTPRRLSQLLESGPVVLFFYPAAMSYGCTKESCHFRDLRREFAEVGGQLIGISADPVDKQRQFAELHSLGFPLLSDSDGRVAAQFGVRRRIPALGNRRTTFVIDTDRRIRAVVRSELSMAKHADAALEALRARAAR
jgi:peroxiredoxin Q/BCP